MSKFVQLALLAGMTASTVSAVDITFKRFSRDACNDYSNHIAEDTHLHDPYCKTFDEDEPAFYSFIVEPTDDQEDMYQKYCYITVYDREDCSGTAFAFGNMTDYKNQCADSPIPGRSVRVSCLDSQTTYSATLPATTITQATVIDDEPLRTLTLDDPTATIILSETSSLLSNTRSIPLPTTHDLFNDPKHNKGKSTTRHHTEEEEVVSMVSETFTGGFPSYYPVPSMETITLVPAPRETDEARRICNEFPHLEGCDEVLSGDY